MWARAPSVVATLADGLEFAEGVRATERATEATRNGA